MLDCHLDLAWRISVVSIAQVRNKHRPRRGFSHLRPLWCVNNRIFNIFKLIVVLRVDGRLTEVRVEMNQLEHSVRFSFRSADWAKELLVLLLTELHQVSEADIVHSVHRVASKLHNLILAISVQHNSANRTVSQVV